MPNCQAFLCLYSSKPIETQIIPSSLPNYILFEFESSTNSLQLASRNLSENILCLRQYIHLQATWVQFFLLTKFIIWKRKDTFNNNN